MAGSRGTFSLYLLPGQKVKIKIPTGYDNTGSGHGMWPLLDSTIKWKGKDYTMIRGFISEDTSVGEISETDKQECAINYLHKKGDRNSIIFFARTEEIIYINITSVPIHDHSSIVTGGPAYGTYFSDDETV